MASAPAPAAITAAPGAPTDDAVVAHALVDLVAQHDDNAPTIEQAWTAIHEASRLADVEVSWSSRSVEKALSIAIIAVTMARRTNISLASVRARVELDGDGIGTFSRFSAIVSAAKKWRRRQSRVHDAHVDEDDAARETAVEGEPPAGQALAQVRGFRTYLDSLMTAHQDALEHERSERSRLLAAHQEALERERLERKQLLAEARSERDVFRSEILALHRAAEHAAQRRHLVWVCVTTVAVIAILCVVLLPARQAVPVVPVHTASSVDLRSAPSLEAVPTSPLQGIVPAPTPTPTPASASATPTPTRDLPTQSTSDPGRSPPVPVSAPSGSGAATAIATPSYMQPAVHAGDTSQNPAPAGHPEPGQTQP